LTRITLQQLEKLDRNVLQTFSRTLQSLFYI
jgi:hypothetical protein